MPAVRCEQLDIDYIDGMLLLPLIVEHTIGGWMALPSMRLLPSSAEATADWE